MGADKNDDEQAEGGRAEGVQRGEAKRKCEDEGQRDGEAKRKCEDEGQRGVKKKPAARIVRKRPPKKEEGQVIGISFNKAITGNVRCYLLGMMDGKVKSQFVQVSAKEAPNHYEIVQKLKREAEAKLVGGVSLLELRDWAAYRKGQLLP